MRTITRRLSHPIVLVVSVSLLLLDIGLAGFGRPSDMGARTWREALHDLVSPPVSADVTPAFYQAEVYCQNGELIGVTSAHVHHARWQELHRTAIHIGSIYYRWSRDETGLWAITRHTVRHRSSVFVKDVATLDTMSEDHDAVMLATFDATLLELADWPEVGIPDAPWPEVTDRDVDRARSWGRSWQATRANALSSATIVMHQPWGYVHNTASASAALVVLLGFAGLPGRWRAYRRLAANRCRRCGYDQTGLVSNQCPECGQNTSSTT